MHSVYHDVHDYLAQTFKAKLSDFQGLPLTNESLRGIEAYTTGLLQEAEYRFQINLRSEIRINVQVVDRHVTVKFTPITEWGEYVLKNWGHKP